MSAAVSPTIDDATLARYAVAGRATAVGGGALMVFALLLQWWGTTFGSVLEMLIALAVATIAVFALVQPRGRVDLALTLLTAASCGAIVTRPVYGGGHVLLAIVSGALLAAASILLTLAVVSVRDIGAAVRLSPAMRDAMAFQAPLSPTAGPPSGWYPDPSDPSRGRYWDGVRWTDHTCPIGDIAATPA